MDKDLNFETENPDQIIWFGYFDPHNSIFKTKQQDRASYSIILCSNFKSCNAYKVGQCTLKTYCAYCPYGKLKRKIGPTKRAKSSYAFIREAKEKYEKMPFVKNLEGLTHLCQIGDYVYIPLNFLDNYVNPIQGDLGINKSFIKLENFTIDTINKLYNYHPLALFGGEIKSYQEEEIPSFIIDLKKEFPLLFTECVKIIPDFKKYVEEVNFIGRKAYVKSLLPGKVRLSISNKTLYDWDGEKIICDDKVLLNCNDEEKVYIFPTDKTKVIIQDNNTVKWGETLFV